MASPPVMSETSASARLSSSSLWTALIVGFLGSCAITAGSFSIGWLASASPIHRWDWLLPWRTTETGVITGTVVFTLGCWLMFWAWIRLGLVMRQRTSRDEGYYRFPPRSLRTVNLATLLWCAPQMLCLPIFSRDIFAYIGQGRLVLAGQDPYVDGISTLNNWFQLGTDTTWAQSETPYGPMFLWIEAAVVSLTGPDNPDAAIFLFRVVALIGVLLIMYYVPKLAEHFGTDAARAQWISAANPLFIISFIASGHNDALMVGLALAGVWFALQGRGIVAILLVMGSVGIKPITLVILPFIALWWAGANASWLRRFVYWGMSAGIAAVIMVIVGLLNGYGFGWLAVMAGTGTGSVPWSPVGILTNMASAILSSVGIPTYWVLDTFKLIGRIASVLIVLLLMFRGKYEHLLWRMTWAFAALVVLSPIIQPWYLLWLLPFFAVAGIRGNWQLKWVIFTVAFFVAFGAADQLFVWQFLEIEGLVGFLSTVISWCCLVWILLLDPFTSRIVKEDWHVRGALRRVWARRRRNRTETTAETAGER
ncbi:polyprenol phosphomannose-dependent alpha 1,6 mannosyltransferase MptB [Micrococcaceae sp. AOP34-BR2-30]